MTVPLGALYEGKVIVGTVAVIPQVPLTDTGEAVGSAAEAELLEMSTEVAKDKGGEEVPGVVIALVVEESGLVAELEVLFMLVLVVGKGCRMVLLPVPENDECKLVTPITGNDVCALLTPVLGNGVCMLLRPVPGNGVCVLLTPVLREVELVKMPVLSLIVGTPTVLGGAVTNPVETEA